MLDYFFVLELDDGASYYAGYTVTGPVIQAALINAYRFPAKENAENVLGGDVRLNGGKVCAIRRNATTGELEKSNG